MLVLSRLQNQSIIVRVGDDEIRITLIGINSGHQARLGFEAPPHVTINRSEIQEKIDAESQDG